MVAAFVIRADAMNQVAACSAEAMSLRALR